MRLEGGERTQETKFLRNLLLSWCHHWNCRASRLLLWICTACAMQSLKNRCREIIKAKGSSKVTVVDLLQEITPAGRASVPHAIKVRVCAARPILNKAARPACAFPNSFDFLPSFAGGALAAHQERDRSSSARTREQGVSYRVLY